jgi:hypothetical protein
LEYVSEKLEDALTRDARVEIGDIHRHRCAFRKHVAFGVGEVRALRDTRVQIVRDADLLEQYVKALLKRLNDRAWSLN